MSWIGSKKIFRFKRDPTYHFIVLDKNNFLQIFPDHSLPQLFDKQALDFFLNGSSKILFYLSAPFFKSFVHETISFTSKELSRVEETLHFRRPIPKNRFLISITTGQNRATTIHSHLSEKGEQLIAEFQCKKRNIGWFPLIEKMVSNFLLYPSNAGESEPFILLLFPKETLQLDNRTLQRKINYVPFWKDQTRPIEEKKKSSLLFNVNLENYTLVINLVPEDLRKWTQIDPEKLHFCNQILFPLSKKKKFKIVKFTSNQKKISISSVNLVKIFSSTLIFLLLWASFAFYEMDKLTVEQARLKSALSKFQSQPSQLKQISKNLEKTFQFKAILEATQSIPSNPSKLFHRITNLLPDGVWLEKFSLTYDSIHLDILDRQGTELSSLIETLNRNIGKTNLNQNVEIEFEGYSLRRYSVSIQPAPAK